MNNTLVVAAPQDVGMSANQLERAFGVLTAATEAGQIGAASLTVARHGKEVFARGCGQQHPRTRQPVDADSIFLLASITKPVTACALMILVDRGLISLNDPAIDYLPEYTGGDRPTVKVRHSALAHIRHARHAARKHQLAAGAHPRSGLCRTGTSDTTYSTNREPIFATRAWASCSQPKLSNESVDSDCATSSVRKFSRHWEWPEAHWEWANGHLKTWYGAERTPKRTKNNKAGVGTPRIGATLGHRGAACTAPDAIWQSSCKPCSTAALMVIGASSAAPQSQQ